MIKLKQPDYAEAMEQLDKFDKLLAGLPELSLHIDKKTLIKNIIEHAKELVNADHVHVRVIDWLNNKLVLEEYVGEEDIGLKHPKFSSINVGEAIGGHVFSKQRSKDVPNVQSDPYFQKYIENVQNSKDGELEKLISFLKKIGPAIVVPLLLKRHLFSWDEIPGNDNRRLIEFLTQNFGVDWVKTAKIEKTDGGKIIKVSAGKNALSLRLNYEYLFSWNKIPGNDNKRLIEFLEQKLGIKWVKTAEIEKIDENRTIRVSTEKNSLSLKLNAEKTQIELEIDDGRTDEFVVKTENGELNIYKIMVNLEIKGGRTDEFVANTENGKLNIYLERKPTGVLTAWRQRKTEDTEFPSPFTKNDIILLEHFANQASVALRNAWLFEAATWQPSESESFTVEKLCQEVVNEAIKRTGARDGRVRFVDWKKEYLVPGALVWPISSISERDLRVSIRKIGICPAGVVASRKEKYLLVNDLQNDSYFMNFRDFTMVCERLYWEQLEALKDLQRYIEENGRSPLQTMLHNFRSRESYKNLSPEAKGKLEKRLNLLELSFNSYLFSWDEILGNDDIQLREFLTQKFGIDWVKTAKIEKSKDGKIVKVSNGKNSLSLRLNDEKTKVNLKIDDGRTDKFITNTENGKLKIYPASVRKHIEAVETLAKALKEYVNEDLIKWNSEVAVPILIGNELQGVLNVHSDKKHWFTESDMAILQALASRVAASIVVHQQRVLNKIHEIEQMMTADRSFEGVASRVAEGIREVAFLSGREKKSEIFPLLYICKNPMAPQKLVDGNQDFGDMFEPRPSSASKEEQNLLEVRIRKDGLGFKAINELAKNPKESVFIVRENVDDPISGGSESAQQHGVITTACLPLAFRGTVYGLLYIHIKRRHFFTELEKETLTLFAAHAAIVSMNLKRLTKEGTYDDLCDNKLIKECINQKKGKKSALTRKSGK